MDFNDIHSAYETYFWTSVTSIRHKRVKGVTSSRRLQPTKRNKVQNKPSFQSRTETVSTRKGWPRREGSEPYSSREPEGTLRYQS